MADTTITIAQLKETVNDFIRERDWNQFHTPKNLSMAISAEAAELLEKFMWCESQRSFDELTKNRQEVEDELADVFITALCFANASGIDISKAIATKLIQSGQKYPVEKAKGRYDKHDKL